MSDPTLSLHDALEQQLLQGRLRQVSREFENSDPPPRLLARESSFEQSWFNFSADELPNPNQTAALGTPNAQEQISDVLDADTPRMWAGAQRSRNFSMDALPVETPHNKRAITRTKSAALPSKSNTSSIDLSPAVLARSRSSSETLPLQQALSLHFSGVPLTLVPLQSSLSPAVLPHAMPSMSPQLSQLPSVQLSIGGFSDVPDINNEDILNCANIIFALFHAIAPRATERNIAPIICDYAYLCNTCGTRSAQLHYCDIHISYECPDCWKTQCCHHNGSCTQCRRVCPNCERESCKHCYGPNASRCDRCCLSLPGFGESREPVSIPMNDSFTPTPDNTLVIINDTYERITTPDYSEDPNNAIIEPDSDSEFDLGLFAPLPVVVATSGDFPAPTGGAPTDANAGPSAASMPMN